MRQYLVLTVAAVVVMLVSGGVADAQVITISKVMYSEDLEGKRIEPKGTFLYNTTGDYTVKFDVGYFDKNNKYVPDTNVAPQKQANPVLLQANTAPGNSTWNATGPVTLTNPAVDLYLRAVLYKKDATGQWQAVDETFTLVNPP